MLQILSKLTNTVVPNRTPAMHSYVAFYSAISGLSRNKWNASGKAPKSLLSSEIEDDESDNDKNGTLPFRKVATRDPTPTQWREHRATIKAAFPEGWSPPRKLSRDAMDGLRSLHVANPELFTTATLAEKFRISPEAVRRILKSKWEPSKEKRAKFLERERRSRDEYVRERREEEWRMQKDLQEMHQRQGGYTGVDKDDRLELT